MSKLKSKVVVVTGASKGIGAQIAKNMAAEGARVVINYATSKTGAEQVVNEITGKGGSAIAVQGDLSKGDDVKRLFEETKKHYGSLDVLVNNAGVFKFDPLETVTETEFHRQFNTNVLGPILATKEALPYFGDKGGSVINISSVVSESAPPASVVYSATKGAVDTIAKVLSKELATKKIRVNTIAPGIVETEGTHTAGFVGTDFEKQMISVTPLGRIGQPEDIARVAVFLASEESNWVTGERIQVAGGYR